MTARLASWTDAMPVASASAACWRPRSRLARRADRPNSSRRRLRRRLAHQAPGVQRGPARGCLHEEPGRPVPLVEERVHEPDEGHGLARVGEQPRGLQGEEPPEGVPEQPVRSVRLLGPDDVDRLGGHRLDRVGGARLRRERKGHDPRVAGEPVGQRRELVGRAARTGEDEQGGVAAGRSSSAVRRHTGRGPG